MVGEGGKGGGEQRRLRTGAGGQRRETGRTGDSGWRTRSCALSSVATFREALASLPECFPASVKLTAWSSPDASEKKTTK